MPHLGETKARLFPEKYQFRMAPLVLCCHLGKKGDLPLITSLILRGERAGLVFPRALEKPWKVLFCWHFPPPHFPTNDPSSQTSALISVARALSCLLRQKGALVGMDSVGSRGKKANRKRNISSQPGNGNHGQAVLPSVPAKNLVASSKPS